MKENLRKDKNTLLVDQKLVLALQKKLPKGKFL